MSAYIQYNFNSTNIISPNIIKNIGSGSSSYNGTMINNPVITTGINNNTNSVAFNVQQQQYISIPSFSTTNNGISFAFWFKSNQNFTWAKIFDFGNGSGSDNIVVFINQGAIGFSVYVGNNSYQPDNNQVIPNMNNNMWNHIAWTLSPTNGWTVYLNGALFVSFNNGYYPNSIVRNSNYIGRSNWSSDPYFTGNIADFRIYNTVLNQVAITSIYNGDLSGQVQSEDTGILPIPPLLNGFNQLYNQIFCNLFQSTTDNGFSTCDNCDFNFSNANNVLTTSSTGGEPECLNLCSTNEYCTAYTFNGHNSANTNTNNCILYGLNNQYPTGINTNVKGSYSGYAITSPKAAYNYDKLTNTQQNNVQLKCSSQYLNNTFTSNIPAIDVSSCLTFSNNNTTTQINADPKCVFNIYAQNKGPVQYENQANYIIPKGVNTDSTKDPNITNYQNVYNQYNELKEENSNINNELASEDNNNYKTYFSTVNSNYNTLSTNFLDNINTQSGQLSNLSSQINEKIGGNIENFENNYKNYKNNNNNNKLLIIILIIFFLLFIIFIFKKK